MDNSKKFETRVKQLKYEVLKEVAEASFDDRLAGTVLDIPKKIIPGNKPTMRCCVYKERAILGERVKLAMGGNPDNPNVIEVISIACDECTKTGYQVTDNCRGCIAHRCEQACPKSAITFDSKMKAHIDTEKCVQCGLCSRVCPYGAITDYKRPCENACRVKAIGMDEDGAAAINNDDCIRCGACVNSCPFGAIMDKSFIIDTIKLIKDAKAQGSPLVAVVAPSIATQYQGIHVNQIVAGLLRLGFTDVVEAAFGADRVAARESMELAEKGTLTSSCCPAFVSLVRKKFPKLAGFVSETPSPMVMAAMSVKAAYPDAKIVFISPCTAKKAEAQYKEVTPFIDNVISFEEMDALLDSQGIILSEMSTESRLDNATRYGRNFAESGGVATAVTKALREHTDGLDEMFDIHPVVCNGIDECMAILKKIEAGKIDGNFFEGMICKDGCINGPVAIRHLGAAGRAVLEKHSEEVRGRKITETAEKDLNLDI